MTALATLLARGDLDELVMVADDLASRESWSALLELRDGCRHATEEFGRQLWGVAHYADYRVALDGPDDLAADVVVPGAGRFALGPLTEVVAQNHRFAALADWLHPAVIDVVAQERVLRGEDLRRDARFDVDRSGLPGCRQPWEPEVPRPTYRRTDRLDGDPLPPPQGRGVRVQAEHAPDDDVRPDVQRALAATVDTWVRESSAQSRVVSTSGSPAATLGLLGIDAAALTPLTLSEAIARLAVAGASGGYAGRRRGGAAGRSDAWWVLAAACDLELPCEPDELEYRGEDRRWFQIDPVADERPASAWTLRLLVADPNAGWCAAIDAHDVPPAVAEPARDDDRSE